MNIRQEVAIPDCFSNFRGKKMKNAVSNETTRFALSFGDKSKSDEMTLQIFKEFGAKIIGQKLNGIAPRPYFSMITDYNKMIEDLDKAFVWSKAILES
jgi:hypothetical protein